MANQVGEKFEMEKAVCRGMVIQDLHRHISRSGLNRAGSWGFRAPTYSSDNYYQFRVNGHIHKGLVGIVLDASDTFTIYYFGVRNRVISKISKNVYIDMLIETLDIDIERIKEYLR